MCSLHFEICDFLIRSEKNRLNSDAVPTIFSWTIKKNSRPERRKPNTSTLPILESEVCVTIDKNEDAGATATPSSATVHDPLVLEEQIVLGNQPRCTEDAVTVVEIPFTENQNYRQMDCDLLIENSSLKLQIEALQQKANVATKVANKSA